VNNNFVERFALEVQINRLRNSLSSARGVANNNNNILETIKQTTDTPLPYILYQ